MGAEMPVALAAWTTALERILDAQRNLACADRAMAHNGYSNLLAVAGTAIAILKRRKA